MVKRKVSVNGDVKATKKPKNPETGLGKIDASAPATSISSLIAPTTLNNFFEKNWEKEHLYIKREDNG